MQGFDPFSLSPVNLPISRFQHDELKMLQLYFCPRITFSSLNYLKVREEKLPPWKKLSAVSQMSPNPDTMEVQMQRSYHLIDEDDTEVDKENVAQGITLTQFFFLIPAYKSL